MSHITTCPHCGRAYMASSEETANDPGRECYECWEASKPAEDGSDDGRCTRFYPSLEGDAA